MSQLITIITGFLAKISPIAAPLLILDIIVAGFMCLMPSQKFRGLAIGFLVAGIVGFILVIGSSTFASDIQNVVNF